MLRDGKDGVVFFLNFGLAPVDWKSSLQPKLELALKKL